MVFWSRRRQRYEPVQDEELQDDKSHLPKERHRHYTRKKLDRVTTIAGVLCALSLFSLSYSVLNRYLDRGNLSQCQHPTIRREWRTLTSAQRSDYIDAVKCLQREPSEIHKWDNASRWDDFPWTHRNVGYIAHDSAMFFSWHRYFLHLLEQALRDRCAYQGPMTYWDWTLDWEDPAESIVFSPTDGFGGNGDIFSPKTPGEGYCVIDGPFAGLQSKYHGKFQVEHCLSRDFRNDTGLAHFSGRYLRPELIEKLLKLKDYFRFLSLFESGPHNAVPAGIRGDFLSFVAPNDPLFYLHHGQIDRIWWIWQQRRAVNARAYSGPTSSLSNASANLDDLLPVQGLARDAAVSEVIDTQGGLLCYTYDRHQIGYL